MIMAGKLYRVSFKVKDKTSPTGFNHIGIGDRDFLSLCARLKVLGLKKNTKIESNLGVLKTIDMYNIVFPPKKAKNPVKDVLNKETPEEEAWRIYNSMPEQYKKLKNLVGSYTDKDGVQQTVMSENFKRYIDNESPFSLKRILALRLSLLDNLNKKTEEVTPTPKEGSSPKSLENEPIIKKSPQPGFTSHMVFCPTSFIRYHEKQMLNDLKKESDRIEEIWDISFREKLEGKINNLGGIYAASIKRLEEFTYTDKDVKFIEGLINHQLFEIKCGNQNDIQLSEKHYAILCKEMGGKVKRFKKHNVVMV